VTGDGGGTAVALVEAPHAAWDGTGEDVGIDLGTDGARGRIAEDALRERWFACSNALGWSTPAEWPHETVDEVCAAVAAGKAGPPLEQAVSRWAGARAGSGIGLAETLSDLSALHTAVSGALGDLRPREGGIPGADGSRLIRVAALGWTDVACGDLSDTAVVDPLSGLASARYLRTRLAEVYRSARARGTRIGDEYALVQVTMVVAGWSRIAPLGIAGDAAMVVFDAGESIAVLGRSTVVVLAPREGLAARVKVLRNLLDRRMPAAAGLVEGPSVRTVVLPATHEGACTVLERLRDEAPAATRHGTGDRTGAGSHEGDR